MISTRKRYGKNLVVHIKTGDSSCTFHDVDDLDTKSVEEAENNYEKTFVVVRKLLEDYGECDCNDEADRLSLCQGVADALRQSNLIFKD